MPKRFKPYRPIALALALYTVLAVFMTWPLAGRLGTAIPGFIGDSYVHLWTFSWVREALSSGQSPFHTDLLFYPQGTTLIFHNFAWLNILGWLLLQFFLSDAAAYTVIHMGVLIFNGLAVFLLAREIVESDQAAFVAGMIAAFWPFIMSHQDHPNLIFIAWIPLALLFLRRMFFSGKAKDALLAALFLVLTAVTRWQLLIMAAPLVGLYILYTFATNRPMRTGHCVRLILLVIAATALALLPLLAPLIYSQFSRSFPGDLFVTENLYVTDLLGFVVPSRYHPLWGDAAFAVTWRFAGNMVYVPFVGYMTIALSLVGLAGEWKKARFWFLAALVYAVFALGPELMINGHVTGLPLPYALIENLFLVRAIRFPERLNVILAIPMAILAAYGVLVLLRLPRPGAHKNLVTAGIAAVVAVEFFITFPTLTLAVPEWYREIAAEAGEFAILDVPMNTREMYDKRYMYYQLTHHRPLVEGHVSRPPREAFDFIESIPFLAMIRDRRSPPQDIGDISNQLSLLDQAGVRYLVLHKNFLRDSHERAWQQWLPLKPLYEDEEVIVYRTGSLALGSDFSLDKVMLYAEGRPLLGLVQAAFAPSQTVPGGWVQADLWWGSGAPLDEDYSVCLDLVEENEEVIEAHCALIAPERPTSRWRANELLRSRHLFQVQPEWTRSDFELVAVLKNHAGETVGDAAVLGDLLIEAPSAVSGAPSPAVSREATWQDLIALEGYDQNLSGDRLDLTFYWRALQPMDASYKFFIHLTDRSSGDLVAQVDYVPRAWTYPTDLWVEGELIADDVSLSLAGVPAGEYQLTLGIYDPESGQRLSVSDASAADYPEKSLPLFVINQ